MNQTTLSIIYKQKSEHIIYGCVHVSKDETDVIQAIANVYLSFGKRW